MQTGNVAGRMSRETQPALLRCVALALVLLAAISGCTATPFARDAHPADSSVADSAQSLAARQAAMIIRAAEAAEAESKPAEAVRLYEQALVLDPQLVHLHRRLAVLHDQAGNSDRAQAAYQQALAHQPGDVDLLNDFGVYYSRRQQHAAAERLFRAALAAQPDHQRASINLGISLCQQGRLDESYTFFARVVGPAAAYSNIGVLLAQQNHPVEAERHLRRAVALDPTLTQPHQFLAHLTAADVRTEADAKVHLAGHDPR